MLSTRKRGLVRRENETGNWSGGGIVVLAPGGWWPSGGEFFCGLFGTDAVYNSRRFQPGSCFFALLHRHGIGPPLRRSGWPSARSSPVSVFVAVSLRKTSTFCPSRTNSLFRLGHRDLTQRGGGESLSHLAHHGGRGRKDRVGE